MTEIARYIPTDAAGAEWIVSVDDVNVILYGVAIITDYGSINTRPYPQLYYGYFFYTTDSSVLGTTVYMYVDTGSTTRRSTTWKSITSTDGNTYYYFTFRPREIVEQLDYNNKQYAGASYTNTYSDGTIINNGQITATSDRDDYKLLGIDTLEDEYGPGPGPEPEPTNDIVIEYFGAFSPYPTMTATFYDCPKPCASICFQQSQGTWIIGVVFDTTASPGNIICKLEDSRGSSYTREFTTNTQQSGPYIIKTSAFGMVRSELITPCDIESDYQIGDELTALIKDYFDSQATKPLYVGVNGHARQVTDMYVGVNGKARKVTAIYVGVNGKAREVFKAT